MAAKPSAKKPTRKTTAASSGKTPKAASARRSGNTGGKASGSSKPATRKGATTTKSKPGRGTAKADGARDSAHFGKARNRAERLLRDPEAADRLADEAEAKVGKKKAGNLGAVVSDVRTLIRLVRAFAAGDYRAVSWESMVLVVAGLVYLVSPLDLIPDFLPGGLADDAVIVTFVIGMVHEEIADFREWEDTQKAAP